MDFLKKYWWVFLLIGIAVVWYFMYMKKKQDEALKTTTKTPSCKTVTQAEYDARVTYWVGQIASNPEWLQYVTDSKSATETIDQAKTRNAKWQIQEVDKFCTPAA